MKKAYRFRDTTRLTQGLKVLLILSVLATAGEAALSAWLLRQLAIGVYAKQTAQTADDVGTIVLLIKALVLLATFVTFGVWIHRSHRNVRALGAEGLRFTPAAAVGYFFVPILNLWKPYQAMKDLWRASASPAHWEGMPCGPMLGFWWALWLSAAVVGELSRRMSDAAVGMAGIRTTLQMDLAYDGVFVLLCVAAMAVVTRIHLFQSGHPVIDLGVEGVAAGR